MNPQLLLRLGPIAWLATVLLAGCPASSGSTAASKPSPPPAQLPKIKGPLAPAPLDESQSTLRFTVMNEQAGIDHAYRNGQESKNHRILESLGGGGGLFDFDGDGLLDLFLAGGGHYQGTKILGWPGKMYRNLGDWKFADVTQPAGSGFPARRYSHGCHAADFDNDGFVDFMVCGYGGLELWHNLGDGTFEEIHAAAELNDTLWSSCCGWADFNGDGFLDVYVVHYVDWSFQNDPYCHGPNSQRESCPPRNFKGLPDALYFSNGDGTFRDVSRQAGLRIDPGKEEDGRERELGKGLGIVILDVDSDGDQDIYVANDTVNNFLYLNRGDGTFEEDGVLRGAATDHNGFANGSMGVDYGDFDRDGLPDLFVANYQHESMGLYRNEEMQPGSFTHVSEPMGITAIGGLFVGFGTVFADLNRDGFEDIVLSNGHVQFFPVEAPIRQEPVVLISEKGEFFRRQRFDSHPYFGQGHVGRGLAAGDIDNDGDLDFCFIHNNDPATVLRNDSVDDGQWLCVRLIGTTSNRDGTGAKLTLHTSQEDQFRWVKGSSSYASHCDFRALWGMPKDAEIKGLTIVWPSGKIQEVEVTTGGNELTVVEPD